jgi:hypothetical protein
MVISLKSARQRVNCPLRAAGAPPVTTIDHAVEPAMGRNPHGDGIVAMVELCGLYGRREK